jgi:ubiquinone/menaquinone biosynthesis C-methylase UbiE
MGFDRWPGFARIPPDDWTTDRVEALARKYDTVEQHGWYRNLDPTVAELRRRLRDGDVLIDYSGGTAILADRLLRDPRAPRSGASLVIVDSSPKFLRLALDKFRDDPRVAFRLIRYLKGHDRLEYLDEVMPSGADALVSTNAIHLYYGLPDTLASWKRSLKPGAAVFVQSGNIRNPAAPAGCWIIDETVEAIHEAATRIVRSTAAYAAYRDVLDRPDRMAAYAALRKKYFLPVRPLEYYVGALTAAGITVEATRAERIDAEVAQWDDFLAVYHEGVLGWVGGVEKIEGRPASEADVAARLTLLSAAMQDIFKGAREFPCVWTYITARC